ncbi:YeaH/YhbH family protein [Bradyrhizobium sp. ISRA443]|uniref:YeaH/YhbH family protein n=1 Tax=unclassified Bradyrhizobium TaxID=2631580 RepID=UPI0024788E2E|nr:MULTISPECIES: YeaH/YhbH family protein [unclassified Bradyrhizobium]WGR96041.1 YeaH/YhbH family protein [Bradyrhizobium sp. ISRA435]WGS02605.1 YeaH/YhbH family protein [Bradyrhizobium sp. ISRA436]WGS09493.1 YeaH/YhbH family protein [Bradyrhizobium sp. ISRA437]WGS16377.1 YeaH/YhbH family protein [Bradyrhizobium sp. ISRA443]
MHIVDRRLNPGSKSLENRQRFLRRAKALVQGAVKKSSQNRDIKDVLEGGEVTIPLDGMDEPRFRREGGTRDMVLPGNKKFVEGDWLPRPNQSGAKGSGAGEGDSEDAFRFVLSRDEFVDLFLDDLELPDLAKRKLAETESEGIQRAGYATSGSPANISISRTVSRALARRVALRRPRKEDIEALEAELAECEDAARRRELLALLEALKAKAKRIPFIDPIDIRYRRFEAVPKPVAQAVMFCLMDVSGSMSEHMKDLAKRFYMLLYVFLKRRYRHVEIVFIRHTDRAEEVDEETFFHGPASGGTLVSSALVAMDEIVRTRFRPADWNIYAAQASDGDNMTSDSVLTGQLLTDRILPVSQFFAYLEVGEAANYTFDMPDSSLWTLYERLRNDGAPLSMRKVSERGEIFPVFQDLFKRRGKQERVA